MLLSFSSSSVQISVCQNETFKAFFRCLFFFFYFFQAFTPFFRSKTAITWTFKHAVVVVNLKRRPTAMFADVKMLKNYKKILSSKFTKKF